MFNTLLAAISLIKTAKHLDEIGDILKETAQPDTEPVEHPYIVMSATTEDLPGFEWAMNTFSDTLTESGIDHKSCVSPGTHGAVCADVFTNFLDWITARENRCNSHVEDTAPDMRTIFTAGFSIQ